MDNTRIEVAFKNASITMVCQIFYIIVSFICRTVFTKILGTEYLGLTGLFSNILTMLSFVELGIGNSVVYKLYKPLCENDYHGLCIYMAFYRKIYQIIALLVTAIGLALTPFLNYLVDAPEISIDIRMLYLLFLLDTVITYLFVYKKSILIADQKSYIIEIYSQVFNIIMNIIQIVILYLTHQFILYMCVKIMCNILCNIAVSMFVDKKYYFVRQKVSEKISKADEEEFRKNIKGLFFGKIASASFDGTDNIFISKFEGVSTIGIASNYLLILSTINGLMNKVFNSLVASIGKLSIETNDEHVEETFKKIYFANTILFGYMFIGMAILLQFFVTDIWLDKTFYLPIYTVILLIVEVCLRGISYPMYMIKTAYGYFRQLQWVFVGSAVLNIILDFLLGKAMGLAGIFLATIMSRTITRAADVYIVYVLCFKKSMLDYYRMHTKYLGFIVTVAFFLYIVCGLFRNISAILLFVIDFFLISLFYFGVSYITFRNTIECKYYMRLLCERIIARRTKI